MTPSRPKRPKTCHCYFCDAPLPKLPPEKTHHRGVHFCRLKCFLGYMDSNRPKIKAILDDSRAVNVRAAARLEELKTEVLWLPPTSQMSFVDEVVIFELVNIIEGRPRVTMGERRVGD